MLAANQPNYAMAPVQLRVLEQGASRVTRSQEDSKPDELWLGNAYNPQDPKEDSVSVYVRLAQPAPLVAELLCCVIARALGLPAPEPFVVVIAPGTLPESRLINASETKLCVATRDLGGTTFAQLLREDSASAQKLIAGWEHLIPVTVLDEWLANTDRNFGNIIFIAQTLHIIDHADAFGGSHRTLFPLAEITHDAFMNRLALILARDNASKRQLWLNQAREWLASTASGLDVSAAVAVAEVTRWQSIAEQDELVHFITTRLSITHRLLCNRLGHPQLTFSSSTGSQQSTG